MERFARHWPLLALLASAAVLAGAHAFETFGHLAPCELCLKERQPYWAAGTIAAFGLAFSFSPRRETARRWANALLVLAFLFSAVLAGYHTGVEWKFWPGPAICSAGHAQVSVQDLGAFLRGGARAMPDCDKPAWVFLGLSLAGWNLIISLALLGASALAAHQGKQGEGRE